MNKRDKWLWLAINAGDRFSVIDKLIKKYKDIDNVYNASVQEMVEIGEISEKEAVRLESTKTRFNSEIEWEDLKKKKTKFTYVEDEVFPKEILKYNEHPYFLFYKGELPKMYLPRVAMIGARACSNYGRVMAREIALGLSSAGVQIISGMARGIDTYSQLGAISGGTPTFAVLGCGVDICYPTENIELYEDIINSGGGIISEYPPGTKPFSKNFPMRNRIISALSDKIAVIEAKEKSGSLITVEWALEQGKDIFAVPGRVNDVLSEGCNRLLKTGAGVLMGARDIMDELPENVKTLRNFEKLNEKSLEKDLLLVYSELGLHPKSVNTIIEETQLNYERIIELLMKLQLMGMIEEISKNYYVKTSI